MQTHLPHLRYRPDIDGLRAIAVLAVVLFHAWPGALPGGFTGVDVFFVISGYLISSIIFKAQAGNGFSYTDFYARRIRRIFPPLLVVVAATLIAGWFVLLPVEYAQLGRHAAAGLGFVANIAFWLETGYFDTAAELKPLLHLWSLGVEEQFYLVWPVFVVVAWRLRRHLSVMIFGLIAASFGASIVLTHTNPESAFYLLPSRSWELLAGAAVAWRSAGISSFMANRNRLANGLSVLGLVALALSFVLINRDSAFPGWWAILPVSGTVLLIVAGEAATINKTLLVTRPMVGIGLISFPVYLWHWPFLSYGRILQGDNLAGWLIGLALVLTFLLSFLSYRFLETPIRKHGGARSIAALVAVSLLLFAGSLYINARDGLHLRLRGAQAKAEARALEWGEERRFSPECARNIPVHGGLGCLIADPSRPADALIIGDSHANHFYWGLGEVLAERGVNLLQLFSDGCPPLYGMSIVKDGRLLDCRGPVNAAIDFAVEAPHVHTVFLGGRWMAYLTGRELRDPAEKAPETKLIAPDAATSMEPGRQEVFETALRETLSRLSRSGKRVIFLHSVPELPFKARECVAWNPNRFVNRAPRPDCAVDEKVTEKRLAEYRPFLDRILADYPQITQIDPVPLICSGFDCRGRRDGILLYRDDDHLSLDGSKWVARQIAPLLPHSIANE